MNNGASKQYLISHEKSKHNINKKNITKILKRKTNLADTH